MARKAKKADKKTLAERALECGKAKDLIDLIQSELPEGTEYVYRGTPRAYTWEGSATHEKRINSGIFRTHGEKTDSDYQPANNENKRIKEVRSYFSPHTSNLEILSDLRHFGGDTTLIDFSSDLLVALFFACKWDADKDDEKPNKNDGKSDGYGEFIAFPIVKANTRINDYFTNNRTEKKLIPKEMSLLPPTQTQTNKARVIAQKSVFIHVPKGFIPPDLCKIIPIKNEIKKPILDYLKHFHDIEEKTIYPDLHGFIAAQNRLTPALMILRDGNEYLRNGEYEKAITKYNEALKLDPSLDEANVARGRAEIWKGMAENV